MSKKDFSSVVKISRTISQGSGDTGVDSALKSHPVAKIQTRQDVRDIDVNKIQPLKNQPRKFFSEVKLKRLSEDIKIRSVLQPIILRRNSDGFDLLVGERRWRASIMAGKATVPSIVLDEVQDLEEMQLCENIHREDLLPEEIAEKIARILKEKDLTQEQLGNRVGFDRVTISKCVKIGVFLEGEGVKDFLLESRSSENFNLGFERLYEAACKNTPHEGLSFLKTVVEKKMTTADVRRASAPKGSKQWNDKTFIKHLKTIRKQVDFTVMEKINIGKSKDTVLREIDNTLSSLARASIHLTKMKGKIE